MFMPRVDNPIKEIPPRPSDEEREKRQNELDGKDKERNESLHKEAIAEIATAMHREIVKGNKTRCVRRMRVYQCPYPQRLVEEIKAQGYAAKARKCSALITFDIAIDPKYLEEDLFIEEDSKSVFEGITKKFTGAFGGWL